jgi:surface antigen|tara:strand:+ start:133 stop:570 length:438 start_codon:yes stop_codon:yes gene_type:complete
MFKEKVLAVKSLMAVGKLSILLLISSPAVSADFTNPKFFDYSSNQGTTRMLEWSFGWFKKLDPTQREAYMSSVTHALLYAETGDSVRWNVFDASGISTPVMTWPTGSGYCRRLHLTAIAYNKQQTMTVTGCYNNSSADWSWYSGK